jgi:hypothetical protein
MESLFSDSFFSLFGSILKAEVLAVVPRLLIVVAVTV